MKLDHMPLASNAREHLTVVFSLEPPEFEGCHGQALLDAARQWYAIHARLLLDAMELHAPGGFMDALLGELLWRKSNVFRVTDPLPRGGADVGAATREEERPSRT